jgi:hypothetical protein
MTLKVEYLSEFEDKFETFGYEPWGLSGFHFKENTKVENIALLSL